MNDYLVEMYIGLRKANGENYEPTSLECIKNSIERHLKEKAYTASLKDRVFNKSISVFTAKKAELKKQDLGRLLNKFEHITYKEECQMFESGIFSSNTLGDYSLPFIIILASFLV